MQILITGGTGSFGEAFVKRLVTKPDSEISRIVIYSRGEHAQEDMARRFDDSRLRFFIGDVRDRNRLELALNGIDTVVHAAALKIVPTAEYNPTEASATNIGGAENVAKAAIHAGVKRVLGLSTDKAVNPINLYGATKLAAEKIFIAANALSAGRTHFSIVRYGNVVGSRGSVIPYFQTLIKAGKTALPITSFEMTRFWITMDQAIDMVLYTLETMTGREIIVPKIPSMHITDLAEALLPGGLHYEVGIRPGEKLHECLVTEDEARHTFESSKYYYICPNDYKIGSHPRLANGFRYTSDTNKDWLSIEQLRAML